MTDILIWVIAGLVVIVVLGLFAVSPFSILPRRPRHEEDRSESAVNEAQNEAELLYRRQPPIG